MDLSERALLDESVRAALGDPDRDADTALADLGWLEMLDAEPDAAMEIVFGALGAANRTSSALDDVVMTALGTPAGSDLAIVIPEFDRWDMPGRIEGSEVHAHGLATVRAATAAELLVVATSGAEACAITVPASSAVVRPVAGVDPDARLHSVRVNGGAASTITALDVTTWERALAVGRRAVSYEILGASRAMLALACAHAVERVQFGRPISSFQAVRHRLADALVAVEALDATLAAARDDPHPLTAALAKATAGRTARTVSTNCQQVLAGIGFTTDHRFHRYLKRTMVLDGLFGAADAIATDLGRELIATRRVPTLIEL